MRSIALALVSLGLAFASVPLRGVDDERPVPGLVTLYANDDLQSSFDFRSGRPGGQVQRGEIRLERAQIAFDVLAADQISFGFVRDERVEVLDLGALFVPPQTRSRDPAIEFPVSILHSLFFDGVRFGYLGPGGDRHPLEEADRILGALPPESLRHLTPLVRHTYLVRVHTEGLGLREEFYAFQVVDLVPEQRLTLRWVALGER